MAVGLSGARPRRGGGAGSRGRSRAAGRKGISRQGARRCWRGSRRTVAAPSGHAGDGDGDGDRGRRRVAGPGAGGRGEGRPRGLVQTALVKHWCSDDGQTAAPRSPLSRCSRRRRQATGAAARSPRGCARPCPAALVASRGPAWLRRPLRRRRGEGEGEEASGRNPQERAEGCVISGGRKNGSGWKIA